MNLFIIYSLAFELLYASIKPLIALNKKEYRQYLNIRIKTIEFLSLKWQVFSNKKMKK